MTGTYTLKDAAESIRPQIEEITNEDSLAEVCNIASLDLYETQFGDTSGAVETKPDMGYYFHVEEPGIVEETSNYDRFLKPICTACWAGSMFIARNIADCRRGGNDYAPLYLTDESDLEFDARLMEPARDVLLEGDGHTKLRDRMLAIENVRSFDIAEAYRHMGKVVSPAGRDRLREFECEENDRLDHFFGACASHGDLDMSAGTLPVAHVWKHSRPPYSATGVQMSDAMWVHLGRKWVKHNLYPFLKDFEKDEANFDVVQVFDPDNEEYENRQIALEEEN